MIGRFPAYLVLGASLSARVFSVDPDEWEALSIDERWALNRAFLDAAIADGCTFRLASPFRDAEPHTYFARELQYLISIGYRRVRRNDGWELVL